MSDWLTTDDLTAVQHRHDDIEQDALPCGPLCPFHACSDCPGAPKENSV